MLSVFIVEKILDICNKKKMSANYNSNQEEVTATIKRKINFSATTPIPHLKI